MNLKCHNCGNVVEVSLETPKEFVCTNCGAVNVIPRAETYDAPLDCLAPTGFEWKLPAGKIGNPIIGYQYVTAQGSYMTREEYIATFKIDPEIALEYMRRNRYYKK